MESQNEVERTEQEQRDAKNDFARTVGREAASNIKKSASSDAKIVGKGSFRKNIEPLIQNKQSSLQDAKTVSENITKSAEQVANAGTKTAKTALASGAATGGVGTIVTLVIAGMKAIRTKLNTTMAEMGQPTDVKKESSHSLLFIVLLIIAVLCALMQIIVTPAAVAFYPLMTAYEQTTETTDGILQKAKVTFTGMTDKGKYFKELFGVDKYDIDLDRKISEEMQIDENNIAIYKKMIDDAIYRCFAYSITTYSVNALEIQNEVKETEEYNMLLGRKGVAEIDPVYASEEAMEKFRAMRYPYTLAHKDGFYYTVGDYLDKKIPESELNNDINYAEIIAVICQNEKFEGDNFSYSDMYDVLMGGKVSSLMFEMKFSNVPVFVDNASESEWINNVEQNPETSDEKVYTEEKVLIGILKNDEFLRKETQDGQVQYYAVSKKGGTSRYFGSRNSEDGEEINKTSEGKAYYKITKTENSTGNSGVNNSTSKIPTIGYYYPSEIAPYGLNELYEIADANPKAKSSVTETMLNIEILNDQESWIRARCPDIDLGPAWNEERPSTSLTAQYQRKIGEPVTGRSCMDYLGGESITEKIIKKEPLLYKNQDINKIISGMKFTPTGESVILDFPEYINQGSYPTSVRGTDGHGDTIKESGCIDCAYTMIEMYYYRNSLNMPTISASYVKNNQFQTYKFMADYGLTFSSQTFEAGNSSSDQPFNLNIITASITQGYPVVLHIKGHWEYNGRVYHQSENGHFLAIIGYDANGLYVYDPGSRNNTENGPIPYEAFNAINYKVLRYVFPVNSDFVPWYRINTIRDGKDDVL